MVAVRSGVQPYSVVWLMSAPASSRNFADSTSPSRAASVSGVRPPPPEPTSPAMMTSASSSPAGAGGAFSGAPAGVATEVGAAGRAGAGAGTGAGLDEGAAGFGAAASGVAPIGGALAS